MRAEVKRRRRGGRGFPTTLGATERAEIRLGRSHQNSMELSRRPGVSLSSEGRTSTRPGLRVPVVRRSVFLLLLGTPPEPAPRCAIRRRRGRAHPTSLRAGHRSLGTTSSWSRIPERFPSPHRSCSTRRSAWTACPSGLTPPPLSPIPVWRRTLTRRSSPLASSRSRPEKSSEASRSGTSCWRP